MWRQEAGMVEMLLTYIGECEAFSEWSSWRQILIDILSCHEEKRRQRTTSGALAGTLWPGVERPAPVETVTLSPLRCDDTETLQTAGGCSTPTADDPMWPDVDRDEDDWRLDIAARCTDEDAEWGSVAADAVGETVGFACPEGIVGAQPVATDEEKADDDNDLLSIKSDPSPTPQPPPPPPPPLPAREMLANTPVAVAEVNFLPVEEGSSSSQNVMDVVSKFASPSSSEDNSRKTKNGFACVYCSKTFKVLSKKLRHEETHTRKRPFSCSFCTKTFNQMSHMKAHERIHLGERPFVCSFCSKTFTKAWGVKRHERIHTGERPFKCSYCTKAFDQEYLKKIHERTHTGERPFVCSYCSKSFVSSSDKLKHERTHGGERPFSCSFCSKTFALMSHKKQHEETTHNRI